MLLAACGKVKPQMPFSLRHKQEQDSAALALILFNQRMALQADKDILEYVKQHDVETFAMGVTGYWFRKTLKTDKEQISDSTDIDLRVVYYSLDGKMYTDYREPVNLKNTEIIFPVRDMLDNMKTGEQAELIVPWYAAYGSTGTADIPPYTNLRIILESY